MKKIPEENNTMFTSAILAAAGIGRRIKHKKDPKPFLVLNNKPIIVHALSALSQAEKVNEIILVIARDEEKRAKELTRDKFPKLSRIVIGGEFRAQSIKNGLAQVSEKAELILVHDAARPLINIELIEQVIDDAINFDAAIAALPVTETIKQKTSDNFIAATIDRSRLYRAQTPQAFKREIIMRGYNQATKEELAQATDSSMLIEKLSIKIKLTEGNERNIKITSDRDLQLAESLLCEAE